MLKVCVTQAAEKGKANKALVELLGKALSLRKSQIELLSGETVARTSDSSCAGSSPRSCFGSWHPCWRGIKRRSS